MNKIIDFKYTKENGQISNRKTIVLSEPKANYLCLDITECDSDEIQNIQNILVEIEAFREKLFKEAHLSSLYRAFKPERMEIID